MIAYKVKRTNSTGLEIARFHCVNGPSPRYSRTHTFKMRKGELIDIEGQWLGYHEDKQLNHIIEKVKIQDMLNKFVYVTCENEVKLV